MTPASPLSMSGATLYRLDERRRDGLEPDRLPDAGRPPVDAAVGIERMDCLPMGWRPDRWSSRALTTRRFSPGLEERP